MVLAAGEKGVRVPLSPEDFLVLSRRFPGNEQTGTGVDLNKFGAGQYDHCVTASDVGEKGQLALDVYCTPPHPTAVNLQNTTNTPDSRFIHFWNASKKTPEGKTGYFSIDPKVLTAEEEHKVLAAGVANPENCSALGVQYTPAETDTSFRLFCEGVMEETLKLRFTQSSTTPNFWDAARLRKKQTVELGEDGAGLSSTEQTALQNLHGTQNVCELKHCSALEISRTDDTHVRAECVPNPQNPPLTDCKKIAANLEVEFVSDKNLEQDAVNVFNHVSLSSDKFRNMPDNGPPADVAINSEDFALLASNFEFTKKDFVAAKNIYYDFAINYLTSPLYRDLREMTAERGFRADEFGFTDAARLYDELAQLKFDGEYIPSYEPLDEAGKVFYSSYAAFDKDAIESYTEKGEVKDQEKIRSLRLAIRMAFYVHQLLKQCEAKLDGDFQAKALVCSENSSKCDRAGLRGQLDAELQKLEKAAGYVFFPTSIDGVDVRERALDFMIEVIAKRYDPHAEAAKRERIALAIIQGAPRAPDGVTQERYSQLLKAVDNFWGSSAGLNTKAEQIVSGERKADILRRKFTDADLNSYPNFIYNGFILQSNFSLAGFARYRVVQVLELLKAERGITAKNVSAEQLEELDVIARVGNKLYEKANSNVESVKKIWYDKLWQQLDQQLEQGGMQHFIGRLQGVEFEPAKGKKSAALKGEPNTLLKKLAQKLGRVPTSQEAVWATFKFFEVAEARAEAIVPKGGRSEIQAAQSLNGYAALQKLNSLVSTEGFKLTPESEQKVLAAYDAASPGAIPFAGYANFMSKGEYAVPGAAANTGKTAEDYLKSVVKTLFAQQPELPAQVWQAIERNTEMQEREGRQVLVVRDAAIPALNKLLAAYKIDPQTEKDNRAVLRISRALRNGPQSGWKIPGVSSDPLAHFLMLSNHEAVEGFADIGQRVSVEQGDEDKPLITFGNSMMAIGTTGLACDLAKVVFNKIPGGKHVKSVGPELFSAPVLGDVYMVDLGALFNVASVVTGFAAPDGTDSDFVDGSILATAGIIAAGSCTNFFTNLKDEPKKKKVTPKPADKDGDGISDSEDRCDKPNIGDENSNGIDDACDTAEPPPVLDADDDGVPNASDQCPNVANTGDENSNGIDDACEGFVGPQPGDDMDSSDPE